MTDNPDIKGGDNSQAVAANQIKAFLEGIERLDEEKKAISEDLKEVYAEAKGNGFDTKALRKLVAIRKADIGHWKEQQALLELYASAIGMDIFS